MSTPTAEIHLERLRFGWRVTVIHHADPHPPTSRWFLTLTKAQTYVRVLRVNLTLAALARRGY